MSTVLSLLFSYFNNVQGVKKIEKKLPKHSILLCVKFPKPTTFGFLPVASLDLLLKSFYFIIKATINVSNCF